MEEPTNPSEWLIALANKAKEMKYDWCVENEEMSDTPPILFGALATGEGFMMPDLLEGHPTETLPVLLNYLLHKMEEDGGVAKYEWLAYVVEGYFRPADEVADPEGYERGTMETEYKTNPASTVREGIIVTMFPWDGDALTVSVPFGMGDDGLPVFDEMTEIGSHGGGNIPDIFTAFRQFCEQRNNIRNN